MKKFFLVITLFLSFTLFNWSSISASEVSKEVYYDLNKGGTQEFTALDNEGNTVSICIEEVPGISLFSVRNGSYKISGSKAGLWEASYYISVSSENITRAYSPYVKAVTGSFLSTRLAVDNSKQATYYLSWKQGILNYNHYLRSTITNSSLKISY